MTAPYIGRTIRTLVDDLDLDEQDQERDEQAEILS